LAKILTLFMHQKAKTFIIATVHEAMVRFFKNVKIPDTISRHLHKKQRIACDHGESATLEAL